LADQGIAILALGEPMEMAVGITFPDFAHAVVAAVRVPAQFEQLPFIPAEPLHFLSSVPVRLAASLPRAGRNLRRSSSSRKISSRRFSWFLTW
jgi:hypothetical protein